MKVIPIPQTRKFNTYSYQQNPLRMPVKQQYDSVSFGNSERFVVEGDYVNPEKLHRKSIDITGSATLGKVIADEDLTVGKDLNAKYVTAKLARIKGTSTIDVITNVDDLVAIGHLTTKQLISQTARALAGATISGDAQADTLSVTKGDLTIAGKTNLKKLISNGGNIELGSISALESIVLSNPNPNYAPKPDEFPTRVLKFNSANVIPEKIKIALDKCQKLVVHAPESVLSKLEFCKFSDTAKGYIGDVLPPKAIERLITLVKTSI